MTKRKITYLLGAGASAETMPMVRGFNDKLEEVISSIKEKLTLNTYTSNLITDLENLLNNCKNHISPDTYAKKIYIQSKKGVPKADKQYIELKYLLSCAFVLLQAYNYPELDKRYDAFLASILNKDGSLPDHVRIVSWNYDHEFELSYANFSNQSGQLYYQFEDLKWCDSVTINKSHPFNFDGFKFMKLNGTAGVYDSKKFNSRVNELIDDYTTGITIELLNKLAMCHNKVIEGKLVNQLKFAWEAEDEWIPENPSERIVDLIANEIKDTSSLVTIGYSFPYYNKLIDTKLLAKMNPDRVYIQSKQTAEIRNRFLMIKTLPQAEMIHEVTDTEYFYIPKEM